MHAHCLVVAAAKVIKFEQEIDRQFLLHLEISRHSYVILVGRKWSITDLMLHC